MIVVYLLVAFSRWQRHESVDGSLNIHACRRWCFLLIAYWDVQLHRCIRKRSPESLFDPSWIKLTGCNELFVQRCMALQSEREDRFFLFHLEAVLSLFLWWQISNAVKSLLQTSEIQKQGSSEIQNICWEGTELMLLHLWIENSNSCFVMSFKYPINQQMFWVLCTLYF